MPSESILKKKKEKVMDFKNKISNSNVGIIVSYKGIDVETDTKLRKEIRDIGASYFVVKNSILRFAANEAGFDFGDNLTGTTALALSPDDPVGIAKIITSYAKNMQTETEFAVKTGFMDGAVIDVETINTIGALPSKQELIGQLLSVLTAPMRGLAVAIKAIAEKDADNSTEPNQAN